MEETLFYVFGIALVLSAVALSGLGLRSQRFPASRVLLLGLVAYFVALVGATATFAVLNAREEQRHRDAEHAEATEAPPAAAEQPAPTGGAGTTTTTEAPKGGEQTVQVSSPADGALEYEPSKLTVKAGTVTIDYDNPSPVDHSVAIAAGSKTLAESDIGTNTTLTATADLKPGKYAFYCTVPGHREAGMEGTLTVK